MGQDNSSEAAASTQGTDSDRNLHPIIKRSSFDPYPTPKSCVSFADPNISAIVSRDDDDFNSQPMYQHASHMEMEQQESQEGSFLGHFGDAQQDKGRRSENTKEDNDRNLDLSGAGAARQSNSHQNPKMNGTQIISEHSMSMATLEFNQVDWANEVLEELADPQVSKYLLPHEQNFVSNNNGLNTCRFANMLEKMAASGGFQSIWRQPCLALYFQEEGTQFDQSVPCVKLEFLFDPAFSLVQVIESIKSEKNRRRWDPFIKGSKVLQQSDSGRLQVVFTEMKPFLDKAPRHFFEKKLHFSQEEHMDLDLELDSVGVRNPGGRKSGMSSLMSQGPATYYTYLSACYKAPKVQGKNTFAQFSSKVPQAKPSQEAQAIFGMHKFEVVELHDANGAPQRPQVQVTMISQVDFMNDADNYEIYTGMHKSMAINALKKNSAEFHSAWIEFLHRQIRVSK